TPASGEGTPVQVRDGPAAVRGDALPPPRHWVARPGKAVGEGAPSQKTCRPPPTTRTPRGRRIRAPHQHRCRRGSRRGARPRLSLGGRTAVRPGHGPPPPAPLSSPDTC